MGIIYFSMVDMKKLLAILCSCCQSFLSNGTYNKRSQFV